jgi:hypothetical protein
MARFYYLVSSLPFLRLRDKPPVRLGAFLDSCASWLSEKEMSQVIGARLDVDNIPVERVFHPALDRWVVFENSLRSELVRIRAGRLGVQAEPFLRKKIDIDPVYFQAAREAVKDPSPHKAETDLLEIRWKFLDSLESGHFFDLTILIVYALKLQLQERLSLFDQEKGQKVFHTIYEGNKDDEERKYRNNNRN